MSTELPDKPSVGGLGNLAICVSQKINKNKDSFWSKDCNVYFSDVTSRVHWVVLKDVVRHRHVKRGSGLFLSALCAVNMHSEHQC